MILSFSDEFINYLETCFNKIKNDIINYINTKLKSINKYKFNDDIIKNNFDLIEKTYEEILVLTDNINKIFNDDNFITKIKLYTISIGTDVIKVYDENKEKSLIDLYDYINKRIGNRVYGTSADYVHIYTKKRKWYHRRRRVTVVDTYNCKSRNNINKINKDLSKIKSNISSQLNTLINNYTKVFEPYLNEYVNYSQTLYTNIYNYYQAQINNNQNVKNIMDKYNQVFDDMMNNIEDNIIKNNNFKFDTEFDSCLNNFEKILMN